MKAFVWCEGGEDVYVDGMHSAIAKGLQERGISTRTGLLDDEYNGLDAWTLREIDVLFWWGHVRHDEVPDDLVNRVVRRIHEGMGLIVLHSGMESKLFKAIIGKPATIAGWRHDDHEMLWTVAPSHPIAQGVPRPLVIPGQEMYCEPFDIPEPDEVIFISSFSGGEVFRSGIAYHRGAGKVFYFSPGHETCPVFTMPEVRDILANAAVWAAPL